MEKQIDFYNAHGEKLRGNLHLPDMPSEKGAVMGHCFTCSRHTRVLIQICQELARAGFMALRFDFSGNGQSDGDFAESSYSKHVAEMKKAADVIAENGASRIVLGGHSMGAAIAVLTASEMQNVKGVCAISGRLTGLNPVKFLSESQRNELRQTGEVSFISRGRTLKLTEKFFSDAQKYDLPERIRALRSSLLIIHGDQDEIIPVTEARNAAEFNPSKTKLAVISGADHMFSNAKHREDIAALAAGYLLQILNSSEL